MERCNKSSCQDKNLHGQGKNCGMDGRQGSGRARCNFLLAKVDRFPIIFSVFSPVSPVSRLFPRILPNIPCLNSRLCQIPLIVPGIALGPLAILSQCHCAIKYPKPLSAHANSKKFFIYFTKQSLRWSNPHAIVLSSPRLRDNPNQQNENENS